MTVSCDYGYSLVGEQTLVCSTGILSSSIGRCEAGMNKNI